MKKAPVDTNYITLKFWPYCVVNNKFVKTTASSRNCFTVTTYQGNRLKFSSIESILKRLMSILEIATSM